jgi:hypothetical protein
MPKPMYVWSGSAWVSVATEVESLAGFATQSYADNTPGTRLVVPTSVAVGSGSGSVGTQGTVTFSGASSVTLNGVFTSTYKNYKIIVSGGSATANAGLGVTLGSANTGYYSSRYYRTWAGTASSDSNNNTSSWLLIGLVASGGLSLNVDLFSPFESAATSYNSQSSLMATTGEMNVASGYLNNTNSYTSFTLTPASGTITGTVSVYGYKN